MRFLLASYDDEKAWEDAGQAELQAAMQTAVKLTHELHARGQYIMASPLQHSSTGKTIRLKAGEPLVTDGPFAETREVLGGFYLIEAEDIDAAVAIATRHPGLRFGVVEVRPLHELADLPKA